MNIIKIIPDGHMEIKHVTDISNHLKEYINDDIDLILRSWEQKLNLENLNKKFISIVTSAEGHRYIPEEINSPNCLGTFMHYHPKNGDCCIKNNFISIKNLYPLPLGEIFKFNGNSDLLLKDREYDYSFIGQFDPGARSDFYPEVNKLNNNYKKNVIFYNGWNQGVGSEEYSRILSNTKIALVPRGSASLDTFRFYEAMRCGCIVLTLIQNEYEFMLNSPHLEIGSWSNLQFHLDNLLNSQNIQELSNKTKDFWENNLSSKASADFILKKINYNKI